MPNIQKKNDNFIFLPLMRLKMLNMKPMLYSYNDDPGRDNAFFFSEDRYKN